MSIKSNYTASYRFKTIKTYVNFKFDLRKKLSDYEKRKIKKYFDGVTALTDRPHIVYRPRLINKLRAAQAFSHGNYNYSGFVVAFVPTSNPDAKITINKKGVVSLKSKNISTGYIPLNPQKLAVSPVDEVNLAISKNKKYKRYRVAAGTFKIDATFSADTVADYVAQLTAEYDNHADWLHGLYGYNFSGQKDFTDFKLAEKKAKQKRLDDKKRLKKQTKKG